MRVLISIVFAATVLQGCATLSKEECMTANWYQIGYEDGSRGYQDSRIGKHRKACSKSGVTPDLERYQSGYDEGLMRFCTVSNGFAQGKSGYENLGVCPSLLADDFIFGYQAGKEIYQISEKISLLSGEYRNNEEQIDYLSEQIEALELQMFSNQTSDEEKRQVYSSIGRMKKEMGTLEERNSHILVERAQLQTELKFLEKEYSY